MVLKWSGLPEWEEKIKVYESEIRSQYSDWFEKYYSIGGLNLIKEDDLEKLGKFKKDLEDDEMIIGELEPKPKKEKAKKVKVDPLTKEELEQMLNEHYAGIEKLLKSELDHVSYRMYNSVKSEFRRQFENG